jgi:hypothetical protein
MFFRLLSRKSLRQAVCAGAMLGLAAPPALADGLLFGRQRPTVCPPQPCPIIEPAPKMEPVPKTEPKEPLPEPELTAARDVAAPSEFGPGGGAAFVSILGDQLTIPAQAFGPRVVRPVALPGQTPLPGQAPFQGVNPVPSVRVFKICDNESPRPRDRVYFTFNYFNSVNEAVNLRGGIPINDINVYRETFGLEKTFLNGDASLGFRLPLNTLTAQSPFPELHSTDTALGDLSIITKYAFWQNRDTGSLLSGGLTITAPTGPANFAGSPIAADIHSTLLTPYFGYIWNRDRLFIQGFSSISVPTDSEDVTMLYNDIALGYYVYRSRDTSRWLTYVVPTFEVHINNPLNHRGAFDFFDPAGTPDVVNLTYGSHFGVGQRADLTVGLVTPVTGPRPFAFEVIAQFNWRFGPGRNTIGYPPGSVLGN